MTTRPVQYDFSGKVVVVTGGSRGIGHSMALGFAAAGAKVAIASRKLESCEATVKEIHALGSEGSAHAAHVGKWEDCDRLADEVYGRWGRADVLINNAGISPLAPSSVETSEELFDKIVGVNLKGPFRLTALFASRMAAGEGGSIINISSTAAIRPDPETAPYAAAKAGLNILTVASPKSMVPRFASTASCAALSIPTSARDGRARRISLGARSGCSRCSVRASPRRWWARRSTLRATPPASRPVRC